MSSPRLVSLITIAYTSKIVEEIWKSFDQQIPAGWEWVIGAGNDYEEIKRLVSLYSAGDHKILVIPLPKKETDKLGKAKNYCAARCNGDFLVFTDPLTIPTPALFEQGFDTERDLYVKAKNSFNARALFSGSEAPEGIYGLSRHAFDRLEGFNTTLNVTDGYELVCRAYFGGLAFDFMHSDVYRPIPTESWDEIRIKETDKVGNQLLYSMVYQEAIRDKRRIGNVPMFNTPKEVPEGQELLQMIGGKLADFDGNPIENESFGVIRAADYLQFLDCEEAFNFMNEVWRVLVPGGWFLSSTPSVHGNGAFCDIRARSYWSKYSFRIFCLEENQVEEFDGKFEHTRIWEAFPSEWHKEHQMAYINADLMKLENRNKIH